MKTYIQNRQKNNLEVLDFISKIMVKYPELRFTQLLLNCGIDPNRDFYEEPDKTLQKLKETFPDIEIT
jgi:hypothetical protein